MSFSSLLEWKFNNETLDTIDTREAENWYKKKYRVYTYLATNTFLHRKISQNNGCKVKPWQMIRRRKEFRLPTLRQIFMLMYQYPAMRISFLERERRLAVNLARLVEKKAAR